ncbi:MAG: PHP domain-containing protein [Syntrophaceae bacterium]|nr:PHP domain-containing protein [Syntrophaceae bacterium]
MILDLHVHTNYSSCSVLSLADILANARARGLDGVCITDHNTMAARFDVQEGLQPDGLCILIGMEYDTPQGDFLIFGDFDELKPGLAAEELLRQVNEQGGIAVGAHPCRTDRKLDWSLIERGLCRIVESINGRNRRHENHQVKDLTEHYDLVQCGGSDAHQLSELGQTATRFTVPITNRKDLIQALQHGACEPVSLV